MFLVYFLALETLVVGNVQNMHDEIFEPHSMTALQPSILPTSLKHLEANYLFENHPIGMNVLPSLLESLLLNTVIPKFENSCSFYNFHLLPGILPSSLKLLRLSDHFNHPIDKEALPSSLQILHFGCWYNTRVGRV